MRFLPLAVLAAALAATPAFADESWVDKAKKAEAEKKAEARKESEAKKQAEAAPKTFSDRERREITTYYEKNPKARKQLPPGLAKKNKLPPGWQKKLAPGQRVPDDVWERRVDLPKDIKLPEEKGTIRVRIDDKVVKVAEKTREVVDVLNLP